MLLSTIGLLALAAADQTSAHHEYCIIGAGPAGVQLGYLLETAPVKRSYVVFERAAVPGAYFKTYPRHRTLISINKRFTGSSNYEYNMRHDWNSLLTRQAAPGMLFRNFDKRYFPHADSLVEYLAHFAQGAAGAPLNVRYNTTVTEVRRASGTAPGGGFVLAARTSGGGGSSSETRCDRVVVATGIFKPLITNDSPLVEWYDTMSLNKTDFEGQDVLILGTANAAFETATHLYDVTASVNLISRHRLRLSWETHYVGDVRGVNNEVLDSYMLKSLDTAQVHEAAQNLQFRRCPTTKRILVEAKEDGHEYDDLGPVDRVLGCTGWRFDSGPFATAEVRPRMKTAKYPDLSPAFESTNVPGLFFGGTLMHGRDWRKSSGGFIHGFRYLVRALHRQMEVRFHEAPWPDAVRVRVPSENTRALAKGQDSDTDWPAQWGKGLVPALLERLLVRINEAAGLYQLFGYLVDVAVVVPGGEGSGETTIEYLEEVPADHIPALLERTHSTATHFFTMGFEYGLKFSGPGNDTFDPTLVKAPDFDSPHGPGASSLFLHPTVRLHEAESAARMSAPACQKQHPERAFSVCFDRSVVATHNLMEEIKFTWRDYNEHIEPLGHFLNAHLGGGGGGERDLRDANEDPDEL